MPEIQFQEIEHKFVVGEDFDLETFRDQMVSLSPVKTTILPVRDVYYRSAHHPRFVFRHRYDRELQHLTVKSLEADPEVRLEVNLDLGQHQGNQQHTVEAFLEALEIEWRGEIKKDIEVYHFPDCEVVYYRGASESRSVACVEFEAHDQDDVASALEVLKEYEELTGFDARDRTAKTLVELLFPGLDWL